jgi:hypothetical protein
MFRGLAGAGVAVYHCKLNFMTLQALDAWLQPKECNASRTHSPSGAWRWNGKETKD